MPRFAILIDGGFAVHKLSKKAHFVDSEDILSLVGKIKQHSLASSLGLLLTYFYHAKPAKGRIQNPIDDQTIDLGNTHVYTNHSKLIDSLELAEGIAVRLGETSAQGWKLGTAAAKNLGSRQLKARDLVPDIGQKGVDLRIGLDIARLSLGRFIDALVVVTGDSDLIPAFKFARREGIQVYLNHLGHGVKRELKVHTDDVPPELSSDMI